jgi:hypothetical protein
MGLEIVGARVTGTDAGEHRVDMELQVRVTGMAGLQQVLGATVAEVLFGPAGR